MSLIVFRICAAVAVMFALVYYIHMFQLNGYHRDGHMRWFVSGLGAYAARMTFALAALISCAFGGNAPEYVSAVLMLLTAYAYLPQKAKKALVFTPRIKRLIFTCALIYVCIFTAASFSVCERLIVVLSLLLSSFVVLIADIINSPAEKAVKRHYINDAKKILADRKMLTVVGITGSYGKTSTKYFLTKLLEPKYNVLMTPASYNTPMGVVKTVREKLKPSHEIFVCEMGAKYKGDIKEICDIVHPNLGIITAIGPQHLESFKTIENIADTKFELANGIKSAGRLYLNFDNQYIRSHPVKIATVSYGIDFENADCKAKILSVSDRGTEFEVTYGDNKLTLSTRLLGKHNVQNLAGCICFALDMGVEKGDIVTAVKRLEAVPHRLELLDAGAGITIIDDAFNANPTGTHAALEVLSCFDGVKIIVTPGMIELGEKQKELNRTFGEECAAVCDYIFLVGERIADDVYDGAYKAGFDKNRLLRFSKVEQAVNAARAVKTDRHKYILLENDLPDNY